MNKNNKLKILKFKCNRCNHDWIPRTEKIPTLCPQCKSATWNKLKDYKMCEVCDRTFLKLHLHHKNGIHSDNRINNRIFVCSNCHRAIHSNSSLEYKIKKSTRIRDYSSDKDKGIRLKIIKLRKELKTVKEIN